MDKVDAFMLGVTLIGVPLFVGGYYTGRSDAMRMSIEVQQPAPTPLRVPPHTETLAFRVLIIKELQEEHRDVNVPCTLVFAWPEGTLKELDCDPKRVL